MAIKSILAYLPVGSNRTLSPLSNGGCTLVSSPPIRDGGHVVSP